MMAWLLAFVLAPASAQLPSLAALKECVVSAGRAGGVGSCGPVKMAGFEYYREIDLGAGRRAMALTGRWSSGVFLYESSGAPIAFEPTGELLWLTVVDFDSDGEAEILFDATLGRGTGVLSREFGVLHASSTALTRIWSARSYYHTERANERGELVESLTEEGVVRLDLSNRLVYSLSRNGKPVQSSVLELHNGKMTAAK